MIKFLIIQLFLIIDCIFIKDIYNKKYKKEIREFKIRSIKDDSKRILEELKLHFPNLFMW